MNHTEDHELASGLTDALDEMTTGVRARPDLSDGARRLARRRTTTHALGAGAPALAAAGAATAILVASGGATRGRSSARDRGTVRITTSAGGATAHARDTAYVVSHARAEIAQATRADVIETTFSAGTNPNTTGWMYVDPRTGVQYQRDLTVSAGGAPVVENIMTATPIDNVLHFHNIGLDYSDHTYVEGSSVAAGPMEKLKGPAPLNISSSPVDVEHALAHGNVRETGRMVLGGRTAIGLDITPSGHPGLSVTLYVDAQTYQPLRLVDTPRTGPSMIEDWLPATPANIDLTTGEIPAGFTRTGPTTAK